MEPIRVLFLAANPKDTTRLSLDEEVRTIDERLQAAKFRDHFELIQSWAVREADLTQALLRYEPHIVHFSGHGNTTGQIILENRLGMTQPVSARALSDLFRILSDNIKCVVLNACFSESQASAIVQHIGCVVGMSRAIDDSSAIAFAGGFYRGLAFGRSIQTSFELGCNEIELASLGGPDTPKLLTRTGVNPADVYLLKLGASSDDASRFTIPALHQLPSPPDDFSGRKEEIKELLAKVVEEGVTIIGIQGLGGVGKTTLALKLADELSHEHCPDAQFYLDLKGIGQEEPLASAQAMTPIIRAYYPTAQLPDNETELESSYRSVLHRQRALLLMDNVKDAAQVTPLIPPRGCVLLITSRRHFALPGMFTKRLRNLQPFEARELLLKIAPRIGQYADEMAKMCGYLPLALRLTGRFLAERIDFSPAEYVKRLKDIQMRLDLVDASLSLSYDLLTEELQQQWAMLAVFPGTFDRPAAAEVWGMKCAAAHNALGELVGYSLAEWSPDTALFPERGRYHLHDLARDFARSHLGEDELVTVQQRHAAHYFEVAQRARGLLGTEQEAEGLATFDTERLNLRAAHRFLSESHSDDNLKLLCQLQAELYEYYDRSGRWEERKSMLEQAIRTLRASGSEAKHDLGELEIQLADVYRRQLGNLDFALQHFCTGLNHIELDKLSSHFSPDELYRKLGDIYRARGEFREALRQYETAELFLPQGNGASDRGKLLSSVAEVYARPGIDLDRALEVGKESLKLHEMVSDPHEIVQSHRILADVHLTRGEVDEAALHISYARKMFEEAGQVIHPVMGWILRTQGDVFLLRGDFRSARDCHERALKIFEKRRVRIGVAVILKRLGLWELQHGSVLLALKYLNNAVAVARTIRGARYALAETLLWRIEAGFDAEWAYRQRGVAELANHVVENDDLKVEFTELAKDNEDFGALWAHFNYFCRRSEITIGVANSISYTDSPTSRFNPLDTIAYAKKHDFRLVQVYLNQWTADTNVREKLVQEAKRYGIRLMCHAPGLLNRDSIAEFDVVEDARAVLQNTQEKWVVYHFDERFHERKSLDVAMDLVKEIVQSGLVPCIENYHQLEGPEQARENYDLFVELFSRIVAHNLPAYAVLDIPRLFHAKLRLSVEEASRLTVDVFQHLADLKVPILLHLVDSRSFEQERMDWCPLGKGVIPFSELLEQLFAATRRIEAVILEFEDKQNPLESRPFLDECVRAGVSVHYPKLSVRWLG